MKLNLNPHRSWIRLSKPSVHYGDGIYEFKPHREFIQEAVNLADERVDFSETDLVLVMSNPEAEAIALGPVFKSLDPYWQIKSREASIPVGITSGYDLNYWGGIWLAHEMGHAFGLPDLYHFGSERWNRYVGTYGLMGTCDAKAPGYFAFERWVLGWLDDSQINCHTAGEVTIELEALEAIGGTKAIVTPLDSTSALVVESRRAIGFDKETPEEGVLVYLVNTKMPGGSGPILVTPGAESEDEFLKDAPLTKGEKYIYQNVIVEVIDSTEHIDLVKVTIKEQRIKK
jgi:M6 family metalloprotease-like protein